MYNITFVSQNIYTSLQASLEIVELMLSILILRHLTLQLRWNAPGSNEVCRLFYTQF